MVSGNAVQRLEEAFLCLDLFLSLNHFPEFVGPVSLQAPSRISRS